ncbi:gamma-glutamyl-gamma-aminobutyrate hydrolase family protein [bacterium]|mgnify:CR=1 FL=1|jgi:putative glutamine amidotransferase|nr:gamma-glutamyl-gamma-aminobutyrate hydrolase family protein [bacterium]
MIKKIVGITCDVKGKFYESEIAYSEKVIKSGGVPFYLPMVNDKRNILKVISCIDSLIVTGSRDIDPAFYGQKKSKLINSLDKRRTLSEILYINYAIKLKKRILGICGGMQLINVVLGGSLHQDIKLCVPGANSHSNGTRHKISIKSDSILYEIFRNKSAIVNSYHHQSIDTLGKSLIVVAQSKDKTIEAFESKSKRILGLQWHPELSNKEFELNFFKWLIMENK